MARDRADARAARQAAAGGEQAHHLPAQHGAAAAAAPQPSRQATDTRHRTFASIIISPNFE